MFGSERSMIPTESSPDGVKTTTISEEHDSLWAAAAIAGSVRANAAPSAKVGTTIETSTETRAEHIRGWAFLIADYCNMPRPSVKAMARAALRADEAIRRFRPQS